MIEKDRKNKQPEPVPTIRNEDIDDQDTNEAADELLDPAMPAAGAGLMLDIDPRLNRKSETEAELERATENVEETDEP